MATKEELKEAAWQLGRLMAECQMGDSFDVMEEIAQGYADASDSEKFTLEQVSCLNSLQLASKSIIQWRVDDARSQDISWSRIGDALDMSKQAAQQRFGHAG